MVPSEDLMAPWWAHIFGAATLHFVQVAAGRIVNWVRVGPGGGQVVVKDEGDCI